MTRALGTSTYGFLYHRDLSESLRRIASLGYEIVEISTAPPHLYVHDVTRKERLELSRLLDSLALQCVSLNAAELNLISPNRALRRVALEEYRATISLAGQLGVPQVVVVPGRRSALIPTPYDDAVTTLKCQLATLIGDARQAGVVLALETSPYGFMGTGHEVAGVVDDFEDEHLTIAFDCANVVASQDVEAGVREVGHRLTLAHISDAWRDRFAHAAIGEGEIDFRAYSTALVDVGFTGPTVYELLDGEDPEPRYRKDKETFEALGWRTSGLRMSATGG